MNNNNSHKTNSVLSTKGEKIVGRTRHYPSTNKEWKDSVYAYNKNYLKDLSFKYKLTNNLLKGHFNMSNLKSIARSRRMRSLIRRSSSKRIITSSPEIKQTSDKTIVTVYTYDRERQALIRNLYFYNRRPYLYNLWLINRYQKKTKNYISLHKKRKALFNNKSKKHFPYFNTIFKNETDFLRFRSLNLYKKFLTLDKNFIFLFLSHILSFFNIKVFAPLSQNVRINKIANKKHIKNILNDKPKMLIIVNNKTNNLNIIEKRDINLDLLKSVNSQQNYSINSKSINIEKLNNYLWYFINNKFIGAGLINQQQITYLYNTFKNNYYNNVIIKNYENKAKLLHYLTKLELNKFKFSYLINNLKALINKVYNKKIELNIVNLKYIYLNSDIYTQSISAKMKKKANVSKILRKSLKLVKVPYDFYHRNKKDNLNNFQILNTYKSINLTNLYSNLKQKSTINADKLSFILGRLFPNHNINNKNNKLLDPNLAENKAINILNAIKYKWVKGIKLEVAGRLTRRNTASRSLLMFRYKGNLNNKQYYVELNSLKSMSTVMLRNSNKANTQYTLVKSKRRIGAFGIKNWISSY